MRVLERLMALFGRKPVMRELTEVEDRIDRVNVLLEIERRRRRLDARIDAQRAGLRGRG